MLDTYSVHCVSVITAGFRTATQQLNSTQLVEKKSSARGPFSGKRLGRESAIRDETLKDHLNLLLASSSSTLLIERRKVTRQPASHSRTQQQLAIWAGSGITATCLLLPENLVTDSISSCCGAEADGAAVCLGLADGQYQCTKWLTQREVTQLCSSKGNYSRKALVYCKPRDSQPNVPPVNSLSIKCNWRRLCVILLSVNGWVELHSNQLHSKSAEEIMAPNPKRSDEEAKGRYIESNNSFRCCCWYLQTTAFV